MSTKGLFGGIIGGVIGWFVGGFYGALYGASLGFGVGTGLSSISADVDGLGKVQVSELNITTASEGIVIPDALGTVKVTGNILGYWNSRAEEVQEAVQTGGKGGGGSQSVTSGYRYYLTWAVGLCMGSADMLYSIYEGDKCVWHGELARPASGGEETIAISGIGSMTFYFGTDDQAANSTISSYLDDPTLAPAYRHQCYAVFTDCFIGAQNRLPIFRFVLRRSPIYAFNALETVDVYDYNPAHAIWHILTTMVVLDSIWLNEDSFDEAATELYYEALGVSPLMDTQAGALSYLESLLAHVQGILRYGIDGKFHLKLLRSGEIVADLPVIDRSVMLDDMTLQRTSWLETINDFKVQYPLRIFGGEVNGEEVKGAGGTCTGAPPVLAYLGCADESYKWPSVLGSYEITQGCGPWAVYYMDSGKGMTEFKILKIVGRHFNSLCREVACAGEAGGTRWMKVKDLGLDGDVYSNTVNISIIEATLVLWGGDVDVDSGDSEVISISGGRPPYKWTLPHGNGLWFDAEHKIKEFYTTVPFIYVFAEDDLCDDSVEVTIRDSCMQMETGTVNIKQIVLAIDDGLTPETIAKGNSVEIYWDGGGLADGGHFFVSVVSGSGYTVNYPNPSVRHTTISCIDGVCGIDFDPVCVVRVEDDCGQSVDWTLRNTQGQWALKTIGKAFDPPCRATTWCWPVAGTCAPNEIVYIEEDKKWEFNYNITPGCYLPGATCLWTDLTYSVPGAWVAPPFSGLWDVFDGLGGSCSGCSVCAVPGKVPRAEPAADPAVEFYKWECP